MAPKINSFHEKLEGKQEFSFELSYLNEIKPYFHIAGLTLRSQLAYRSEFLGVILSNLVFVGLQYYIWKSIFGADSARTQLHNFSLGDITTYIVLGWTVNSLISSAVDSGINAMLRNGRIALELLKPLDFQTSLLAKSIGISFYRLFFITPTLLLGGYLFFGFQAPESVPFFLYFIVSVCLSFVTLAFLNFIVGLLAFYLHSIDGIITAKQVLLQIFSGLLIPMTFFPLWLQRILDLLPFKNILYVPLSVYLGKIHGTELAISILHQIIWCVALCLIGRFLLDHACRKLSVEGG